MNTMASQNTSITIIYSTVYSDIDQRKHQSSASLAFVRVGLIHRWPVNSHTGTVTRKMFPFDDVIIWLLNAKPLLICPLVVFNQRWSIWKLCERKFRRQIARILLGNVTMSVYSLNQRIHRASKSSCPSSAHVGLHTISRDHFYSWWRHQMDPFSALLALCAGN